MVLVDEMYELPSGAKAISPGQSGVASKDINCRSEKSIPSGKNILANDHYVAIPYDCTSLGSLATDGVIPEGTIIPANNATAVGVLLNPVVLAENPNGTIVIHGFIKKSKLPVAPDGTVAIPQVQFMD